MNPLVSIIVPLYNRAELVKETIQSVLDQTYPHWELNVVDDGSTDGSDEVVKAYAENDKRIKFHYRHCEPKGAPTCRNIGIEKSTGEYVIFLDSDDLLAPWCLEERVKHVKYHPEQEMLIFPLLVFYQTPGDSDLFWNKANKEENDISRFLAFDSPWCATSPIWKKESILKLGAWDETLISWQDWELHIRALAFGLNYKKIECRPNFFIRRGNSFSITQEASKHNKHISNRIQVVDKVLHILKSQSLLNSENKKLVRSIFYYQAKYDIYKRRSLTLKCYFQPIVDHQLLSKYEINLVLIYLKILKLVITLQIPKVKGLLFRADKLLFKGWFFKRDFGLFHYRIEKENLDKLIEGLNAVKYSKV